MENDLRIQLMNKLEDYLQVNTIEIPQGIDPKTMWILGDGLSISNPESYNELNPYEETEEWDIRFSKRGVEQSDDFYDSTEYKYLITYRFIWGSESRIITATLIN